MAHLIEAKVLGANTTVGTYAKVRTIDRAVVDTKEVIGLWTNVLVEHAKKMPPIYLKSIKAFNDLQSLSVREHGEVFAVSYERAEELLGHPLGIVSLVEEDEYLDKDR